jgi:hypothetical protein
VNVSFLTSCDAKQSSLACACCCGCGSLWSGYPMDRLGDDRFGLALATTVWVIDRVHDHRERLGESSSASHRLAETRAGCALHWQLHQWWRGIRCGSCELTRAHTHLAYVPSRASSVAEVPAERAICAPCRFASRCSGSWSPPECCGSVPTRIGA